jgi:branched-chain amino acid transport system substrate-binding protein
LFFNPIDLSKGGREMKSIFEKSWIALVIGCFCFLAVWVLGPSQAMAFEPLKGDLSKYDPKNQTLATGDTIKIAMWDQVSGVNAYLGEAYTAILGFVAQDINSQGGIRVDGKMKKVQFLLADTQGRPDPGKRAAEKAILQDKINVFAGVAGSHLAKVGMAVAKENKTIFVNVSAYADELMDLPDWNEYVFRTCGTSATSGKSLAIFYEKRPETKFYILAQDYAWGHSSAGAFKKAIKETKPSAQIVGEEYFPVYTKDFAPYLEKVRASGAEAIIQMAWGADNENLIKQSRELGLKSPLNPELYIPMASPFLDDTRPLEVIGGPAGRGLVLAADFQLDRRVPNVAKLANTWTNLWKTWKSPYNTTLYQWPNGGWYRNLVSYYWYFQVLQKAGSTDPKKVIAAWEGDTFDFFGWKHYMRPDDHQVIADRPIMEMVFPNTWDNPKNAMPGPPAWIPAEKCMPTLDEKLKGRVKK